MIVDAIVGFVLTLVTGLLSLLPDIAPPDISGAVASLSPVWGYFGWANKYVPLVEVAAMLTLLAGVQLTLYVIHFVQWIAQRAHLFGGGG